MVNINNIFEYFQYKSNKKAPSHSLIGDFYLNLITL